MQITDVTDGEKMARTRRKEAPQIDDRKIAVYVRKSKITESGKSIDTQKTQCIEKARSKYNFLDSDILIYEDEGKSGFYSDRPGYLQMKRDIRAKKIKAVFCYKIDRISRQMSELLDFMEDLNKEGIAFISASDEDFDTTTTGGKLMLSMLAAIAEFERNIITERITDNMYELSKEGRWLGGECPLGYYSKKEHLRLNGRKSTINHLEVVEDEQQAVKALFAIFLQTLNYENTAERLNAEGHKTKKKKAFTPQAVRNILKNPVYAVADADMRAYFAAFDVPIWAEDSDFDGVRGIMAYNKTEQYRELDPKSTIEEPRYKQVSKNLDMAEWVVSVGRHRGIVSGADWVKAQVGRKQISSRHARPKESTKALLSGLVRCSVCGSRMYVKSESGRYNPDGSLRFRYDCSAKRYYKGCKGSPNVKGYELDTFVVEQICKMSEKDNTFFSLLMNTRSTLQLKMQETERERRALQNRLKNIEKDIQSQIENLRTAPETVKQAIYKDIGSLEKEREEKQARIDAIDAERESQDNQIADIEKARQTILDFPRLMELVGYEEKLGLIHKIVESVIVKDDNVHIFLKGTEADDFFVKASKRSDVCHKEIDSILNAP